MLQFLPVSDGNTIAIRASGKLTHEDYQVFLPQLETHMRTFEQVSILLELDNFSGWELDAAKDDFNFGMSHWAGFERIAIVGDKAWEYWMTLMAKPFISQGEVQYFNRENLQDAWDWLRERQELEKAADQLVPYQNIVVAVDFSVFAKHAARRALELAGHYNASLTLLNVAQEFVPYSYYGDSMHTYIIDPSVIDEQNKQYVRNAEAEMCEFLQGLTDDRSVQTEVLSGETASTIVSFLQAQNADLVIFGAKKRRGLGKLLGTTPHYVQNHTRCETLIVPLSELDASF
ncbi:MAG: Unknown protein [uncultured Thiotrichaceae bacterium]|uniref:UspA domain-containing protein n=1 Tax=uncultured Thiotrichaceae bacterium TaxID=298394 RepID=A0A6S6SK24_9GAMM|nr:MAG: Unknown protein [uncultured Thiotrichaceae bacterium]